MFLGCLLPALLLAAPLSLAPGETPKVSFISHGPVGMKIEGASPALTVSADGDAAIFTLPLSTLSTGIDLRDKHMREALETELFPTATLRISKAAMPAPTAADGSADATGDLTLHGQTKPVVLHCHFHRGAALEVTAELQVDMSQFGIKPPSYLGVKVKPEVEVSVAVKLQEAPAGGAK